MSSKVTNIFIVYQCLNMITGASLWGSTKRWPRRKSQHMTLLRNNKHYNNRFQNAWNKYGEENFTWIILDSFETQCEMINCEQRYLDRYYDKGNCYNLNPLATGGNGRKRR